MTPAAQIYQRALAQLRHNPNFSLESTIFELVRLQELESADYINDLADHTSFAQSALPRLAPDRPFTVLMIDGSPEILRLYQLCMERTFGYGVTVLTAPSAIVGILQAVTHYPHLIISDVTLPLLDGLQLFYFLRTNRRTARIPFAFVTAYTGIEKPLSAYVGPVAPPDDYLFKPTAPHDLIRLVARFMNED